jgi:hypothetical protein
MDADLAAGHVEVDVTMLAVLSAGSVERLSERVTAFDGVVRAAGGCVPAATWHQHAEALVAAMPFGVLTKGSDL